jgi:hypothetical protein
VPEKDPKLKIHKHRILESAICTAVAFTVLIIAAACGGSNVSNLINGPGSAFIARIANHTRGHNSLQPKSSNGQFLSALFFQSTSPTPSQLPESFEGTCDATGANPTVLASGFAVLNVANGIPCGNGSITVAGAVGAFANNGIPVAFSGTITVLKVTVITQSNQHVRCVVTNGNAPVNDNDFIQPYYNYSTNQAVLGVGSTTLPVSCTVPVPAGDPAVKVSMEWSKS